MIHILNENFASQVKRELRKHKSYSRDVYVVYDIINESKTGTMTIRIYNGENATEISSPISFDEIIVSHGLKDGKPIKRIVFSINPVDIVMNIITHNHYLEAWKNAYSWDMKVFKKGETNDTYYHVSMINFLNEKRNKGTTVKDICFEGGEMIQTEDM